MPQHRSVDFLIAQFQTFLEVFDKKGPFNRPDQQRLHGRTIGLLHGSGGAQAALVNPVFQRSLYETLQAWGIGMRGSRLRPFPDFVEALLAESTSIGQLDPLILDDVSLNVDTVARKVARLVQRLSIVDNKCRVVASSKALHHILPRLVVPIDREYTQRFFQWQNPQLQYEPEKCVIDAVHAFVRIAREADPAQYVTGDGWYLSTTKVIDNAIVGFVVSGQ